MPAKAPTQLALKVGFLHLNPSTLRGVSWVVTKWFISHVIKVVSCKYRYLTYNPTLATHEPASNGFRECFPNAPKPVGQSSKVGS